MNKLADAWYKDKGWTRYLRPLSGLFGLVSSFRRARYRNTSRAYTSRYPLIVVGNITAGGTGKTPLVIYLANQLQALGYRPGIVSRGYGAKPDTTPFAVTPQSNFREAGEEPLMIARNSRCPVIIDPDRVAAVQYLEANYDCNIIISDDGMQHYRLNRTMEIAVVDGQRGFGNGMLLPAGPLREKPQRLDSVDIVVCNGHSDLDLPQGSLRMDLEATDLVHLADNKALSVHDAFLSTLTAKKVHAVAGIGNPERFFNSLCGCGFDIITHIYRDHHFFNREDISFDDDLDVVMTEKDAVKCQEICTDAHWYLKVTAVLPESFMQRIQQELQTAENTNPQRTS